jgi:hypothetical protein
VQAALNTLGTASASTPVGVPAADFFGGLSDSLNILNALSQYGASSLLTASGSSSSGAGTSGVVPAVTAALSSTINCEEAALTALASSGTSLSGPQQQAVKTLQDALTALAGTLATGSPPNPTQLENDFSAFAADLTSFDTAFGTSSTTSFTSLLSSELDSYASLFSSELSGTGTATSFTNTLQAILNSFAGITNKSGSSSSSGG